MLKILKIILSILLVTFGGFMFITRNLDLMPYPLLLLGVFSFVLGLIELKKDRKSFWGYANIGASVFIIFVVIFTSI